MTDLITDDDGFTELVDPSVPRVDLVGAPANGAPGWLLMKQDAQTGLMPPEAIRDLIGKSEPEPPDPAQEMVTMSGSPGAIAKLIHEAAVRQAGQVAKADKPTKDINDLPDSDFAYIEPGGKKDDGGKTVPRSLRHFPVMDAAHVRNALSRAPQSPFGDKAMPKIRAAAKKFGIEVSKMMGGDMDEGQDGLDPTVVLASPDDVTEAPGDPNDPGSPAWEAIDAATARKWTSILARARGALGVMADREMLEAATADPSDADDACDLQDAACAIDYAISIIAPFAVDEQAEADCGADMQAVGKALAAYDSAGLDTIEATAAVRKAGRTLSAANEQAIRDAVSSLQKVLASLPAAPVEKTSGPEVAKTANEEPNMPAATPSSDVTEDSGQEPAMGTKEPMEKADGSKPEVVVVYDQKGRLVGIVDPGDITPVANAEAEPDDMDGSDDGDDSDDAPSDDTQTPDLTPQPADEAGTPADAAPSDDEDGSDGVTKSTNDDQTETLSEMFKSSLLAAVEDVLAKHSASQTEQITKAGDAVIELADLVETLKGRVGALEEQPAEPRVFTNGAVPPAHQLRGQDRGAPQVDVTKARELRAQLYAADAGQQNQAAIDLQTLAIAQLREIHNGGARQ